MEYPTDEHQSFIVLPHKFPAIRVFEDEDDVTHMTAATFKIKFSCTPIEDGKSTDEMTRKAMVGFQRLRTWLDAVLNNIIIIDVNSPMLEHMQNHVGNLRLYTPGKPDDSLLAVVFHSKATAITRDLIEIHSICLSSTDTENTERYYRNTDGEYELPGIEYYKDLEINKGLIVINDTPWWERPTIDICEYCQDEDDDDVTMWLSIDPLSEIGKDLLTNDEEADIIVFDALKKDKE